LFFDEHVEADAVHENVAAVDLAGGLIRQDPALASTLLWGAEALSFLEARWCAHLLECWRSGRCSLLAPPAALEPSTSPGAAPEPVGVLSER